MKYQIFSENEWIYPDSEITAENKATLFSAKGADVCFQILTDKMLSGGEKIAFTFDREGCEAIVYQLLSARVTENSGPRTGTTTDYETVKYFVTRKAPFELYEVTKPIDDGETVAERAVRLVNRVSAEMLREEPQLKIVFGLHATSVKRDMATIAKTDPRIEILWEDTANFPYSSAPIKISAADGAKLTADVMASKGHTIGIVWKSQLVQDWANWTYQEGPFLMGVTSRRTFDNDVAIQDAMWKNYTTQWITNFPLAYAAARQAHQRGEDFELCVAAQLNGPLRLPTMLTAELFWSSSDPAEKILARVLDRNR